MRPNRLTCAIACVLIVLCACLLLVTLGASDGGGAAVHTESTIDGADRHRSAERRRRRAEARGPREAPSDDPSAKSASLDSPSSPHSGNSTPGSPVPRDPLARTTQEEWRRRSAEGDHLAWPVFGPPLLSDASEVVEINGVYPVEGATFRVIGPTPEGAHAQDCPAVVLPSYAYVLVPPSGKREGEFVFLQFSVDGERKDVLWLRVGGTNGGEWDVKGEMDALLSVASRKIDGALKDTRPDGRYDREWVEASTRTVGELADLFRRHMESVRMSALARERMNARLDGCVADIVATVRRVNARYRGAKGLPPEPEPDERDRHR